MYCNVINIRTFFWCCWSEWSDHNENKCIKWIFAKVYQGLYLTKLVSDIVIFSLFSWCRHPLSPTPHHSFTGSRGYPEFCATCLESFTGCHRVHPSMGRWIGWIFLLQIWHLFKALAVSSYRFYSYQILGGTFLSPCLLHPPLIRWQAFIWAVDIALLSSLHLQED